MHNCFPLSHIDASVLTLAPVIVGGCTAAMSERFSASRFLDEPVQPIPPWPEYKAGPQDQSRLYFIGRYE